MTDQLQLLALDQIAPAKDNPRRNIGDVTELAASIKSVGLLEPLIATTNGSDGKLVLVAGARRLAAAKKAGLETVPVIVKTLSEAQRIEAMLIENIQREDLDPLEEAHAYKKLFDLGYTQHKLSERIGRSQSHISKRISLLGLPAMAQKALDDGKLSLPDAYELTKLASHPERVQHAIVEKGRNGYFRDMKQVVESEVAAQGIADACAALRQQLQSEGVKIVATPRYEFEAPAGTRFLGSNFGYVDLTVDAHKKLPCHAAFIDSHGKAKFLCTKPASHASSKEKAAMTRDQSERQRQKEEGRLKREAERLRTEFLQKLLTRRVTSKQMAHAIQVLIEHQSAVDACHTAKLLCFEAVVTKGHYGGTFRDYHVPLTKAAAKPGGVEKVLLAMALARGEETCSYSFMAGDAGRLHYEFITRSGYEPNAYERKAAKSIKKDAKESRQDRAEYVDE